MIKEKQYISINEILSRVTRHPKMQGVTKEQAVQYVVDFLGIVGAPNMFEDNEVTLEIEEYRAKLPCDLVSINQVKDEKSGLCLRSMTDIFRTQEPRASKCGIISRSYSDATFKTQGTYIYTSFKEGTIIVSYKSIPVDEEGFPMLIDNANFLKALELYIKREVFTMLFDSGDIAAAVLQNVQSDYAWYVASLEAEFIIPSVSEMESIKNMWTTLIPRTREFNNGFRTLGTQEFLRKH